MITEHIGNLTELKELTLTSNPQLESLSSQVGNLPFRSKISQACHTKLNLESFHIVTPCALRVEGVPAMRQLNARASGTKQMVLSHSEHVGLASLRFDEDAAERDRAPRLLGCDWLSEETRAGIGRLQTHQTDAGWTWWRR